MGVCFALVRHRCAPTAGLVMCALQSRRCLGFESAAQALGVPGLVSLEVLEVQSVL